MIKRRFYKVEHWDGDSLSSSSSSSSESEHEDDGHGAEEEEEKEVAAAEEEREKPASPSTASSGSGYESEDSSGDEINCDSTANECEEDSGKDEQNLEDSQTSESHPAGTMKFASTNISKTVDPKDPLHADMVDYVLKCKSVFKCRICPRIVCLSEDTLLAHLRSKRHARSKKLLGEGRLKLMLNSDGVIEEEQETHAERHARIVSLVEKSERKNKGRQRQRKRKKRKLHNGCAVGKTNPPQKKPPTKRRRIED